MGPHPTVISCQLGDSGPKYCVSQSSLSSPEKSNRTSLKVFNFKTVPGTDPSTLAYLVILLETVAHRATRAGTAPF